MSRSASERMKSNRAKMRAAGMRPVQLWLPDIREPGFAAECGRQSAFAAESDLADAGLLALMDGVLDEALGDVE